jgi:Uma2 family endonuclease
MTTKAQLLTIADWDAMPYGDGNRYEIIEGELFVSCSPGLTHERVVVNLVTLFVLFLEKNPVGEFLINAGVILSQFI